MNELKGKPKKSIENENVNRSFAFSKSEKDDV